MRLIEALRDQVQKVLGGKAPDEISVAEALAIVDSFTSQLGEAKMRAVSARRAAGSFQARAAFGGPGADGAIAEANARRVLAEEEVAQLEAALEGARDQLRSAEDRERGSTLAAHIAAIRADEAAALDDVKKYEKAFGLMVGAAQRIQKRAIATLQREPARTRMLPAVQGNGVADIVAAAVRLALIPNESTGMSTIEELRRAADLREHVQGFWNVAREDAEARREPLQ